MALRVLTDLPKFINLCTSLRMSKYRGVGLLETLWHMTARVAPRGDIGKESNKDIASWVGWEGNADELVKALLEFRWLDEHPTYRLVVHDWNKHSDKSIKTLLRNRGEVFVQDEKQPSNLTQIPKPAHGEPDPQIGGPPVSVTVSVTATPGEPENPEPELTAEFVASEFWFQMPGMRKPLLEDVAAEFVEKVRIHGAEILPDLLEKARDPARDKTQKLWEFWIYCGIGKTYVRDPPPLRLSHSPDQIREVIG